MFRLVSTLLSIVGQFSGVISLSVPTWLAGVSRVARVELKLDILGICAKSSHTGSDHQRICRTAVRVFDRTNTVGRMCGTDGGAAVSGSLGAKTGRSTHMSGYPFSIGTT